MTFIMGFQVIQKIRVRFNSIGRTTTRKWTNDTVIVNTMMLMIFMEFIKGGGTVFTIKL